MLSLDLNELDRWRTDNGDGTHNVHYPLNSDSVVMDLGGFKGIWAQQIIDLYKPNMYIIEPVGEFYSHLVEKFSSNSKVKLMNVGVSDENKESTIYVSCDSSSLNGPGVPERVKLMTLQNILALFNLTHIDLMQINIEGDEYPFMEKLVDCDIINHIKYIQIQFHVGMDNHISRRNRIRGALLNLGFKNRFNYPFVWEGWENKNI
jgi:FkbM family methyltransferase